MALGDPVLTGSWTQGFVLTDVSVYDKSAKCYNLLPNGGALAFWSGNTWCISECSVDLQTVPLAGESRIHCVT